MARIAARPDVGIVFPVHPNPNVQSATEPMRRHENILLIEPVDYPELVHLLKRCHFVVTDSGGIQEEAPSFGKPVLVTREATERPEAMEQGLAKLVGTDERLLFEAMSALLDDPRGLSPHEQGRQPLRRRPSEPARGRAAQHRADPCRSDRRRHPVVTAQPRSDREGRSPSSAQPRQSEATAAQIAAQVPSDNATITISAVSRLTRGMVSSADSSATTEATHWRPSSETGFSETASLFTDPSVCDRTRSAAGAACDPLHRATAILAAGQQSAVRQPSKIRPLFFLLQ